MGIAKDELMQAQAQLWERIDALAASLPQLSISRLAHEVDELRRIAGEHGLAPVVEIAHRLESELALSRGGPTVASFLEAMRDARKPPAQPTPPPKVDTRRLLGPRPPWPTPAKDQR